MTDFETTLLARVCSDSRNAPNRSIGVAAERVLSDPINRRILRYRYLAGLKSPEISALTGLSTGAVRVRLLRIRRSIPSLSEIDSL